MKKNLANEIYDYLIAEIREHRLLPGGQLPSESTLCRQFYVSRPTVRKAIARLCEEGYAQSRPGLGSYVTSEQSETPATPANRLIIGIDGVDFHNEYQYYTRISQGARAAAEAAGAMLCLTDLPELLNSPFKRVDAFIATRVDRDDFENAAKLQRSGTPLVLLNRYPQLPELAYRTEKLAVIDHHRKVSEFKTEPDVEYIEPSASSTCEIVAEMLEQVLPKDDLSPAEADIMLAGITLDTKQFTQNVGTRTFSAAMYLRDRGASTADVKELFRESFTDYMREAKFRRNVEIYRGSCAITIVDDLDDGDRVIAAKAADNLLKVVGIEASFAVVKIGDVVHISARSQGSLNVQLVLENMGGGGHFDSAAVQCREKTVEEVVSLLKESIDKFIK